MHRAHWRSNVHEFVRFFFRGGFAALVTAICFGCAPRLMKLPSGAGTPATDAAGPLAEATARCRNVSTITAEIAVSGSVGGQRLRGRLLAGLAPPASARLEATAPVGQPIFIFVASGDDATLLLPRDGRVLQHGRPAAVLAAVAGVPLDPSELRLALTGCAADPNPSTAKQFGDDWRVVTDRGGDVYLHRDKNGKMWRIVAAVHHATADADSSAEWRAEYGDFQDGLPHSVRLTSSDRKRFDLRLALSQVELDTTLGPEVFRVEIPRDVEPISLDELRRARLSVREN